MHSQNGIFFLSGFILLPYHWTAFYIQNTCGIWNTLIQRYINLFFYSCSVYHYILFFLLFSQQFQELGNQNLALYSTDCLLAVIYVKVLQTLLNSLSPSLIRPDPWCLQHFLSMQFIGNVRESSESRRQACVNSDIQIKK